jgi:transcriptional regulator with XRE-family HTH domain
MSTGKTQHLHTLVLQTVYPVDIFSEIVTFKGVVTDQQKQNSLIRKRRHLYELFGQRVRKARKACKLTQEALASRVTMTRTSVTNIEKGRQKLLLHTLFDLADALQVPVGHLIPEPSESQPQIEQTFNTAVSQAEKEWIVELSKPSKKQKTYERS